MAVIFVDSFDHYDDAEILQKWTNTINLPTIVTGGRNDTNCLRCPTVANGVSNYLVYKSYPDVATIVFGVAVNPSTLNIADSGQCGGFQYNDGTQQVSWKITTGGSIQVYRGNLATLIGTSTSCVVAGAWTYLEFKVTIDNSAGVVIIRANGVEVLNLSGADTLNGTAAATTGIVWVGVSTSSGSGAVLLVDDVYIANTTAPNDDFLGPGRAMALFPDGAGNSSDFTPSAGSNYQNVDEASTDGDTTYNSETTAGNHDTYTYAAMGVTGVVKAVQTNLVVRSDGGGAETIAPMIRIGGVDYQGTTAAVTTSYLDNREVFNVSPATAAAWTVSEIDGAEFGIKLVS